MAQCCASGINMAQTCASCINIHVAQYNYYGSMLCIWSGIIMAQDMAHCCTGINLWSDAVHQASQYGSNLWIMYQYGEMQCIHDSSCASCINMAYYSMTQHTKLTTSYFVHLLFCYFALERKKKEEQNNKTTFWLVATFATLTLLAGNVGHLVR